MRKSLLFLLGAAMLTPQINAAVENKGVKPLGYDYNYYYGRKMQTTQLRFAASGHNFVRDEYNQLSMPENVCYSVGMWYKVYGVSSSPLGRGFIIGIRKDEHMRHTQIHWGISVDSNGLYKFESYENASGEPFDSNDWEIGTFANNEWHHVVVSIDNINKSLKIFMDGELAVEKTLNNQLRSAESEAYFNFDWSGAGQITDEIQFFDHALNAEEVAVAYKNAGNVAGVSSVYTMNKVAEGTLGTFKNNVIGGADVDANYVQKHYGAFWAYPDMLVNHSLTEELDPVANNAVEDGRDMATMGEKPTLSISAVENGSLSVVDEDGNDLTGAVELEQGTTITVSATPAPGYALVGLFAKTANGETTLINNTDVFVLGNTELSAKFSNEFCNVNIENEHSVPFVVYHNGIAVLDSEEGNTLSALAGETYKVVFDVPFNLILDGVTVNGEDVASVDNACEFTVNENTSSLTVNASLKETFDVTINQPVFDGESAGTLTVTGWNGEIENGGKAVVGDKLTVSYTAAEGYRFLNFVINNEPTIENSVVVEGPVSFGADIQVGKEYPAMTRTFTNGIGQQNRYLKSMKQVGVDGYLFNAETDAELGAEFFPGPTNTYLPNGAIVNKTGIRAGHFQIDQATKEFAFLFTPWKGVLNTPEGPYNTEVGWTKYAVYVDWNNDGDFTDDGEIAAVDEVDCSSAKYDNEDNCTKTITVPSGLAVGTYRMRIVFYEPGDANWYETLFETCQIRNGVAYDFDIDVATDRLDAERTVTIASNHAESGSVKFGELPEDAKIDGLTVTTDYKYITAIAEAAGDAQFVNWTNGETMLTTNTTYVYEGTEDATIVANFGYAVNTEAEGEGRVVIACDNNNYPSGSVLVYGSEVVITPVAEQGYQLDELTVNGEKVEVAADGTYTFKLEGTTNIKAVFGVHTYTVTYKSTGEGELKVGYDYDADSFTVLDEVEQNAEVTDDNLFFCQAVPANGQKIYYIKYITSEGEHLVYDHEGNGVEVADDYSDDAYAWYTPSKTGIGFVVMGGTDDYEILVDFSGLGTGINGVELDAANGAIEYYNLQGVKVAAENLTPGFYIARQGNKAVKVLINK